MPSDDAVAVANHVTRRQHMTVIDQEAAAVSTSARLDDPDRDEAITNHDTIVTIENRGAGRGCAAERNHRRQGAPQNHGRSSERSSSNLPAQSNPKRSDRLRRFVAPDERFAGNFHPRFTCGSVETRPKE